MMKQVTVQILDLHLFSSSDEDSASALRPKLLAVLAVPNQSRLLQLEFAATVDTGELFVKATYHPEGDGPSAFESYGSIYSHSGGLNAQKAQSECYWSNSAAVCR